jgi:hypothetical protein
MVHSFASLFWTAPTPNPNWSGLKLNIYQPKLKTYLTSPPPPKKKKLFIKNFDALLIINHSCFIPYAMSAGLTTTKPSLKRSELNKVS